MDIFIPILIGFVIFMLCSLCGLCCRNKRNEGAIYSTPVVVTSQTHQTGPYPVTVQSHAGGIAVTSPAVYPPQPYSPQTYPPNSPPQPGFNAYQMPQPGYQPMPQPNAYPPYPVSPAGPAAAAAVPPPSYAQATGVEDHQKQSPYNPHYPN